MSTDSAKDEDICSQQDQTPEEMIQNLIEKEFHAQSSCVECPFRRMTSVWREKVAEWCYEVVDRLEDNREIVFVTMRILDSYLSSQTSSDFQAIIKSRRQYQAVAMTCLLMGMKICGRKNFGIDNVLRMGNGTIQREDIVLTGKRIMRLVDVKSILPTTPFTFCEAFSHLLPAHKTAARKSLLENARYFTETSIFDTLFSSLPPSIIAIASIVASIRLDESNDRFYTSEESSTFLNTLSTVTGINCHASHIQILEFNLRKNISPVGTCVKSRPKSNITGTTQNHSERTTPRFIPIISEEDLTHLETRHLSRKRTSGNLTTSCTNDESYSHTSTLTKSKRSRTLSSQS